MLEPEEGGDDIERFQDAPDLESDAEDQLLTRGAQPDDADGAEPHIAAAGQSTHGRTAEAGYDMRKR